MQIETIKTLGDLKKSGYKTKHIKDEMRDNLIAALKNKVNIFEGIHGFDDTVIPDLERAILSRHHILLLGLRGQAKTRLARLLVRLLDEYIPVVEGSEINDDPLMPLSPHAKERIKVLGDETLIEWLHRDERYVEKLATPDVSVADIIGDVDPIKAATLKLPYADERVIHYGMIPRANRSIFVINELPDLQPRIQVSLFNILQEGDLQIRGFKVRLPLDILFLFTANPEDYTNRGSIITPLKDRIDSQIITHYPLDMETAMKITAQESRVKPEEKNIIVPQMLKVLLEQISFEARTSELVDINSGVSARLGISAYENLVSAVELRMLKNNESSGVARISDFVGVLPAITGKVELVYEGEQLGPYKVAFELLNKAIKTEFLKYFPHPEKLKKNDRDPYGIIKAWFAGEHDLKMAVDATQHEYKDSLAQVSGLERLLAKAAEVADEEKYVYKELVLHGLASFNILNKELHQTRIEFSDLLGDMGIEDLED
ncbi:MAG: magnesium chelatase [Saprospiraceae bacterium]|nr:magnesium chelatase [Saprospiraceae bacterium]MBK7608507.1 magnesium chelatase [Saprospiraceae bacterium]